MKWLNRRPPCGKIGVSLGRAHGKNKVLISPNSRWRRAAGPGFMSNTGMENPNTPQDPRDSSNAAGGNDTDQRLTELEIKASFAEDLLDQLDKVIVRQQQQIDALLREVAELKAAPVRDGEITTSRSLRDELPPHF